MTGKIFLLFIFCFAGFTISAQTREDLEKQRQQLKKEIEETQKLLSNNRRQTQKSLSEYLIVKKKADLQNRVIENIDKDLHILDNNIYVIQKDVNRFDRLLDTLQQEYAKSMVYAYKNRGNYEFLNFIFSADNFNDAIKRIAYLKSYRNFREMQGENIIRTQQLRKNRLEDLGASKQTKSSTLQVQTKEMSVLQDQKKEQDKIVTQLKNEGRDLNSRIVAKQKQMAKVNAAVKAAIAASIRAEEKRRAEEKLALEKKKREDALATKNNNATTPAKTTTPKNSVFKNNTVTVPENKKLNDESENIALSNSFKNNQGSLPWPVDNGAVLMHFGPGLLPSGGKFINPAVTISSTIGTPVKTVFEGVIIMVTEVDDGKEAVTVRHGDYYTTYSNLSNVTVKKDQEVRTGQTLGRVAPNLDGIGSIDFYAAKGYTDLDPEKWLRRH